MRASDIYVLLSNGNEGLGVVINEAIAEKCTVIASKQTGRGKAIIQNMGNGILFNSINVDELSEKISLLVNNKSILNTI